jgi:hypothetical protein
MRSISTVALLAGIAVVTVTGQTLTEQLQKGIYTEDTLGRVDEAIAIYRHIVATAPAQHDLALQARRRLAAALEQNTPAVTVEGRRQIVVHHPDPLGMVEAGRYRHTWTGVEFTVPEGWVVDETFLSSDSGQQVQLRDPKSRASMSVWMIKEKRAPTDIVVQLAEAPAEKVNQRQNLGYLAPGMVRGTYSIPKETIQPQIVDGQQAMMAVGAYQALAPTSRDPVEMTEYMTWVYTEDTRAFFFGRVSTADLPEFRQTFDGIIFSAQIP